MSNLNKQKIHLGVVDTIFIFVQKIVTALDRKNAFIWKGPRPCGIIKIIIIDLILIN